VRKYRKTWVSWFPTPHLPASIRRWRPAAPAGRARPLRSIRSMVSSREISVFRYQSRPTWHIDMPLHYYCMLLLTIAVRGTCTRTARSKRRWISEPESRLLRIIGSQLIIERTEDWHAKCRSRYGANGPRAFPSGPTYDWNGETNILYIQGRIRWQAMFLEN